MPDADLTLDGEYCIIDGACLHVRCSDLAIDAPDRRRSSYGERRALTHGHNDELVLNREGDYPGGVVCHGDFRVQRSGAIHVCDGRGRATASLDYAARLELGGNDAHGSAICRNADGTDILRLDAQHRRMDMCDASGRTRVRLAADDFTTRAWPVWPGESAPTQLDLVEEIRRLKEEVLALRAQIAPSTS
jgi:hypothetical protein